MEDLRLCQDRTEGEGDMIPMKLADRTLTEMQDLDTMAAKLLETCPQAASGTGAPRRPEGNREISCADHRAEGEEDMTATP